MKKSLPTVVLVGRTNVGKSTLFNRLSTNVKSITFDEPGITRDLLADQIRWNNTSFEIVDSGGIVHAKTQDPIEQKVREMAETAIKNADIVVFIVDGTTGILPEDRMVSKLLFEHKKNVILVANKIDVKQAREHLHEFYQLGHGEPLALSAQHGTASGDLLDRIVDQLHKIGKKKVALEIEPKYRVVLLGKPNVGKSSLMNLLADQERSIVSDVAGTTREAISAPIQFYRETINLVDTPGIRRKRGITEKLEQLMVHTAFRAIKDTDIVLLLVDSSQGILSDQELKLAFYVFEQYKALIILFNKQDLATDFSKADLGREIDFYKPFMRKIPQLSISCKTGENIGKIMPLVTQVWENYSRKIPTPELTEFLKKRLEEKPLYHQSKPLLLYKAEQIKSAPMTLLLFVNEPAWFGPSQLAFFENSLRARYTLEGAPIQFVTRKRG